jgi:ubiquinone/menaquinone biosynthesis C-methylase UbiE
MDYDSELRLHNEALRRACAVRHDDNVLDIGCGAGQTTRDAARAAPAGSALGIDTSAAMIARARELAGTEGLSNVRFETGDAQTWHFPPQHFDVAISRFGTMFFADPMAAFRNIRNALKPGGRLAMMVWQTREANEWSVAIQQSLAREDRPPVPAAATPNAFSLADPGAVEQLLSAAGFAGTTFRDVHEPVYYGASVEAALDWIKGFLCTKDLLGRIGTAAAERVLDRLRETLAKHQRADGVWFDSRAWVVTAHCATLLQVPSPTGARPSSE